MDVWSRDFHFDYSYWSYDQLQEQRGGQPYASQEYVFNDLGQLVINNSMEGKIDNVRLVLLDSRDATSTLTCTMSEF